MVALAEALVPGKIDDLAGNAADLETEKTNIIRAQIVGDPSPVAFQDGVSATFSRDASRIAGG